MLAARLNSDFARFPGSGSPAYQLRLHLGPLPPLPPGLQERFRGPHFVCFGQTRERYIRYANRAWLRWDGRELDVYAQDPEEGYLRLLLCVQSRLGELLEKRGLHRVHGLGLRHGLVLLPPGGGKSTLAWELLRRGQGQRLLSEDTPLLDLGGRLHSFPFRLGLRDDPAIACERQGHKWLVPFPLGALEDSVCRHLVIGAWTTSARPQRQQLGRLAGVPPLLRDALLGYGVPQLIELYWPLSPGEQLQRVRLAAGRVRAILGLLARCRVSRLWLCPDTSANLDCLDQLLEEG